MKKTIILILFTLISGNFIYAQQGQELIDICSNVSGEAKYLKDFQIKLDAADPPPTFKQSIVLSKNTIYQFSVCNSKDFPGEAVLQVFDNNRLIITSHNVATGEDFPTMNFKCSKTGVYHIFVQFKDGQEGLAVSMLSFVKKF